MTFLFSEGYALESISSVKKLQDHLNHLTYQSQKVLNIQIDQVKGRSILPKCQKGDEYQLGACYRACGKNSTGVGPLCFKKCRPGFKDLGMACYKTGETKIRKKYSRGLGSKPICSSNQEKSGLLCYPKCKTGYQGKGTLAIKFAQKVKNSHPAIVKKLIQLGKEKTLFKR